MQKFTQTASRVFTLAAIGLLGVVFALSPVATPERAQAAFNEQMNLQARVTDPNGNIVGDGTYNMEFKLMTVASGGDTTQGSCTTSCVWMETRTGSNRVTVSRGLMAIQLGSVTSLSGVNFNQDLWLSVRLGGTGSSPTWDNEMSPRDEIGTSPTALLAANASLLNGLSSGNASGNIPISNGTLNVNLNADLLDGQTGSYYLDLGNATGTLNDARLSSNVPLKNTANTFTQDQTISSTGKDALQFSDTTTTTGMPNGGDTTKYRTQANPMITDG